MTALVHAYQHIVAQVPLCTVPRASWFQFAKINQKGIVTFCLLAMIALGALQYLGAIYGIFFSGFELQRETRQVAQLTKETDRLELSVQETGAQFPIKYKEILVSMEKISEVTYVTGENAAVSYISPER